jgi:hypothetical protein
MAEPDIYIRATCAECGTLIIKPQKTPASTFTAYSYRSTMEILKAARPATGERGAVCSQCREKIALSVKDRPK